MSLAIRLKAALRAFRASALIHEAQQTIYESAEGNAELKTTLDTAQQDFYKKSAHVYSCVNKRVNAIARPPLRVFKRGEALPLLEHPLQKLLERPTPFHTRSSLQRRIELSLCTWGNACIAIEFDKLGRPYELWYMRPDWVRIETHATSFIDKYVYNVLGENIDFSPDELIHFQYEDPFNQFWGLTPLSAARLGAEFGIDAMTSNRVFFKNYAMPATGLVTKEPVTDVQAKEILARWNATLAGATQKHKAIVLGAVEPKALTMTPKDAEWLAGMKFSLSDASRIFGVPLPLLGEDSAVYKNIADAEAALWHETLIPELMSFEEIWNMRLVTLFRETGLYVAYDLSVIEALQENANATSMRHERYARNGIKTINEIRNELGLPEVAWGKAYYMPLNVRPVESVEDAKAITTMPSLITQRLALSQENDELARVVTSFFASERELIADAYSKSARQAYDWSRWERSLKGPVSENLRDSDVQGYATAESQVGVAIDFELANERARAWASRHAAELLDASNRFPDSITNETRRVVKTLVDTAVNEGKSINVLREQIMSNPIFGRERAQMIARTETQRAYNVGNIDGYRLSGVVSGKAWVGGDACDVCIVNIAQGAIGLDELFASGDDAPPAHPNCLCSLNPVIKNGRRLLWK